MSPAIADERCDCDLPKIEGFKEPNCLVCDLGFERREAMMILGQREAPVRDE